MHNEYPNAPPNPSHTSNLISHYNDAPPPYPLNEVTAIGWSPRVAIVEDNVLPNTHLPIPMPMVQNITMPMPTVTYRTMNNDRLTTERLPTYDFTRHSSPTASANVSHIAPVRSQTLRTSADFRRINSPHTHYSASSMINRCGIFTAFLIIATLAIILVIVIATVSRKNIKVYNS